MKLKQLEIYDETMIIISSDHGENQGELNVYGDHQTADLITSRVPMIIKFPGLSSPRVDPHLYYQGDIAASITEWAHGIPSPCWDVRSFAEDIREGKKSGRDFLVLSQCAWSCQRSVVFEDYILIKTYHPGLKDFPEYMLFHRKNDPHELHNLADERPDLIDKGIACLQRWHDEMMKDSTDGIDPMRIVLREGGPFHTKGMLNAYCERLERTGRTEMASLLRQRAKEYT